MNRTFAVTSGRERSQPSEGTLIVHQVRLQLSDSFLCIARYTFLSMPPPLPRIGVKWTDSAGAQFLIHSILTMRRADAGPWPMPLQR